MPQTSWIFFFFFSEVLCPINFCSQLFLHWSLMAFILHTVIVERSKCYHYYWRVDCKVSLYSCRLAVASKLKAKSFVYVVNFGDYKCMSCTIPTDCWTTYSVSVLRKLLVSLFFNCTKCTPDCSSYGIHLFAILFTGQLRLVKCWCSVMKQHTSHSLIQSIFMLILYSKSSKVCSQGPCSVHIFSRVL